MRGIDAKLGHDTVVSTSASCWSRSGSRPRELTQGLRAAPPVDITMRSPMNKENRHTTRTVVAKRGSVVLAPVPTAREPRRPRSQQTDAVLQLVTAVKDHLRFRQLATYAVDTFAKSLAPPNADWRAYVEAALDVDAANVVVSALDAHAGDKDVLGACATCLGRLAVDARHAAHIADAGGVRGALVAPARAVVGAQAAAATEGKADFRVATVPAGSRVFAWGCEEVALAFEGHGRQLPGGESRGRKDRNSDDHGAGRAERQEAVERPEHPEHGNPDFGGEKHDGGDEHDVESCSRTQLRADGGTV